MLLFFAANLFLGSVKIPAGEVFHILTGGGCTHDAWSFIVLSSRLPQAVTALLCGMSLAAAGLILQTAFRNPLAGPEVLGINSGASLGVAVVMLLFGGQIAGSSFSTGVSLSVMAGGFLGAMVVMGLILFFSTFISSSVMLLIVGLSISYLTSSFVSLLNYFSTAEGVHSYMIWGMGNFGGVSTDELPLFVAASGVGILLSLLLMKPLNALLLGDSYAANLGVNVHRTRVLLLITTGLLTAVATAFCGPIAFLGLAVPHIARLLLGSNDHRRLLPATLLMGGTIALLCNLVCQLPGESGLIPLNAVTPLIGAPVIIYVIVKRR